LLFYFTVTNFTFFLITMSLVSSEVYKSIVSGDYLGDEVISAIHTLLNLHRSNIHPRNILFGMSEELISMIDSVHPGEEHLQIIFREPLADSEIGHYATIHYDGSIAHIYDSAPVAELSSDQRVFIKALLPHDPPIVFHLGVQRQLNGRDCGVFAAAFMLSLAHGHNPEEVRYDISRMRPHLAQILALNQFNEFPELSRTRVSGGRKTITVRKKIEDKEILKEREKKRRQRNVRCSPAVQQLYYSHDCVSGSSESISSSKTECDDVEVHEPGIASDISVNFELPAGSDIPKTNKYRKPKSTLEKVRIREDKLRQKENIKKRQKRNVLKLNKLSSNLSQTLSLENIDSESGTEKEYQSEPCSPVFVSPIKKKGRRSSNITYKETREKVNERIRSLRSSQKFKEIEREKDKLVKRMKKLDIRRTVIERQKHANCRRDSRQDPHFRSCEMFRDIKARSTARQDKAYRANEQARDTKARSIARNNPNYASIENASRKTRAQIKLDDWQTVATEYFKAIKDGYAHPCYCCGRLWRLKSLKIIKKKFISELCGPDFIDLVFFMNQNEDQGLFCSVCYTTIRNKKSVPKLACSNGLTFPNVPEVLAELTPLEERLVSPRHAFLKITRKGDGLGYQFGLSGNVVNVAVPVDKMVSALPRLRNDDHIITVELKRKMCYKHGRKERVRPHKVRAAASYLVNTELFRAKNITLSEHCLDETVEDEPCTCVNGEAVGEIEDEEELIPGAHETLVMNDEDLTITMAPGEGQRPLSLAYDDCFEELAFIKIHCGQKRKFKVELSAFEVINSEISRVDRRAVQRPDYLFSALKKLHHLNIARAIQVCLRKKVNRHGTNINVADVRDKTFINDLVQHDDGYRSLRAIKNSPAHWEDEKKKVLAMIRQFGVPTFFITLSAAESRWTDLIVILKKVVDKETISFQEAKDLPYLEKARLIQQDPYICATYFDHRLQETMKTWKCINGPFNGHKLEHFYYRIEFQHRGSPHAHIMLWLSNAPVFQPGVPSTANAVVEFVDSIISCNVGGLDNSLIQVQKHKHTHTCHPKPQRPCRFGIPFFPMDMTRILMEIENNVDQKQKKMYTGWAKEIKEKLSNIPHYVDDYSKFLNYINFDQNKYFLAVRSTIRRPTLFLKRGPKDVWINPYCKKIAELHQSNMDVQFIFDPYACALYIVNYINKSDRGMSKLLRKAVQEAKDGNKNIKESLRAIANVFLNASEISAQEAIYSLTRLATSKCSEGSVFINTSPPNERVHILKTYKELEELAIQDCNSLDIFKTNNIDHYSNRPESTEFETMCLAHFIANYEVTKIRKQTNKNTEVNELSSDYQSGSEEPTPKIDNTTNTSLLKNGQGRVKKRTKPLVIRYRRYNIVQDPVNFYREKVMLYLSWRDESKELLETNCKEIFLKNRDEIIAASKPFNGLGGDDEFDKMLTSITDAEAEEDQEEFGGRASAPLEGYEFEAQVADIAEDLIPGITPGINQEADGENYTFAIAGPPKLTSEAYLKSIRMLNNDQRAILTHIIDHFRSCTLPLNLFVSGGAGVGKSILIRAIYHSVNRLFDQCPGSNPDDLRVLLTAPTGRAAFMIGGQTLHKSLGLPVSQAGLKMPDLSASVSNTFACKMAQLKLVIIDEASMVGSRMFYHVHKRLTQIFKNSSPFGGISVLVVGDFRQLPPVGDNWIFQPCISNTLNTLADTLLWEQFFLFELTKIMRQQDDLKFALALNNMASGEMTQDDISLINQRTYSSQSGLPPETSDAIHLFATNKEVDAHNSFILAAMNPSGGATVNALDFATGDCSESARKKALDTVSLLPTTQTYGLPKSIILRIGARYMCTVNIDTMDGLVNGATGRLRLIDFGVHSESGDRRPLRLWLEFEDPDIGKSHRQQLKNDIRRRTLPEAWTPIESITCVVKRWKSSNMQIHRTQFPLVPAEAITVHKSQGGTLKSAVVHLGSKVQRSLVYVGCSRVTSANGLFIVTPSGIFKGTSKPGKDSPVVQEMSRLKTHRLLLPKYKELENKSDSTLQVFFHNVEGFKKHNPDLSADPVLQASDVVLLVESLSRLGDSICLEGYDIVGQITGVAGDHVSSKGYGTIAMVKQGVRTSDVTEINDFDSSGKRIEMVAFTMPNHQLYVAVVYRSPNCDNDTCTKIIDEVVDSMVTSGLRVVIAGDFNSDLDNSVQAYLTKRGFKSLLQPGTITTAGHTCIDNILVLNDEVAEAGTYLAFYSYHKPLWFRCDSNLKKK